MCSYGSLERTVLSLSRVINDICTERALSEIELDALSAVAHAKELFQKARVEEAAMAEVLSRMMDVDDAA